MFDPVAGLTVMAMEELVNSTHLMVMVTLWEQSVVVVPSSEGHLFVISLIDLFWMA